jgi:hypothetical protein
MPVRAWIGSVAVGASVLAACWGSGSPALPFGIYRGSWNGALAQLQGELDLHDGCLVVRVGDTAIPVAFANEGTSWDAGRRQLRIDSHVFRPGEPVTFGGGSRSGDIDWLVPPPDSCAQFGTVTFFAGRP